MTTHTPPAARATAGRKYPAHDYCPTCGRYGAVKVNGRMYIHSHKTNGGGCRGGKAKFPPPTNPPPTNEETP